MYGQVSGGYVPKPVVPGGKNKQNSRVPNIITSEGMEYNILGNKAILSKGKAAASIKIPEYIRNGNKQFPVTEIGNWAFSIDGAKVITEITFSKNLKIIGDMAFDGCINLKKLHIPSTVTEIKGQPFHDCYGLLQITVDSNNPVYDSRNNCNAIIESKTGKLIKGCINTVIPSDISTIGTDAFFGCSLVSISIPDGVTTIEGGAFSHCSNLSDVKLPSSLEIIGAAFTDCYKLKSIELPRSVKMLDYTFAQSGLRSIFIPASLEIIKANPLAYCKNLESIVVANNNKYFDSRSDCNAIIRKSDNQLLCGCKNTVIPNTIKAIGNSAFIGCVGLQKIEIPEGVTVIDKDAFFGCKKLTTISLPSTLNTINSMAFNLSAIKSIRIPEKVKELSDFVFPDELNVAYIPHSCKISSKLERLYKIVRY